MGNTNNKKPRMPQSLPQAGGRRSGLGRGLASLIPSGDNKPSLGDGAADVILGQRQSAQRNQHNSPGAQSSDASGLRSGKRDKKDKNDSAIVSRRNSGITGEADKRTVEASKNTAKNSSGVRADFNRHRDVISASTDNAGNGSKIPKIRVAKGNSPMTNLRILGRVSRVTNWWNSNERETASTSVRGGRAK